MNTVIAEAIANFFSTVCSAAVIGVFAYFFRKKIFRYIADAKLMRRVGVSTLRKNSRFRSSELKHIFKKASFICVFYKTGERFWKRLEDEEILSSVNPDLKIRVMLADPDSKQSSSIYKAECEWKTRDKEEPSINEEIKTVKEIFDKYKGIIEYRTDPDLFFLPYMIVGYNDSDSIKLVCYLGLNIIPVRSPNSLQIVSEKVLSKKDIGSVSKDRGVLDSIAGFYSDPQEINNYTLVEQLFIHFDTAWKGPDLWKQRNSS